MHCGHHQHRPQPDRDETALSVMFDLTKKLDHIISHLNSKEGIRLVAAMLGGCERKSWDWDSQMGDGTDESDSTKPD